MILQTTSNANILIFAPILLVVISIYFFVTFFRKYLNTRQKMFGYLSISFITNIFYNLFQVIWISSQITEIITVFFLLSHAFNMFEIYSMVIVFEVFERDIKISLRQIILTILLFIAIGVLISPAEVVIIETTKGYIVDLPWLSNLRFIEMIFYSAIAIWMVLMLIKSRKRAWLEKQKKLVALLFLGIFLSFFIRMVGYSFQQVLDSSQADIFLLLVILSSIFEGLGMLLIGSVFLWASNEPWLLQRQKIHLLVVYHRSGVKVYSKSFSADITPDTLTLLSGSFSAITSLIKEATSTTGDVKAILLEGKELRLISKKHFVSAILVDYSNNASEYGHNKFSEEFENEFNQDLKKFDGDITPYQKAEKIAKKYFS